jgi:hypothetical protein
VDGAAAAEVIMTGTVSAGVAAGHVAVELAEETGSAAINKIVNTLSADAGTRDATLPDATVNPTGSTSPDAGQGGPLDLTTAMMTMMTTTTMTAALIQRSSRFRAARVPFSSPHMPSAFARSGSASGARRCARERNHGAFGTTG